MSRVPLGERVFRALLQLYPRAFRARFGEELVDFYRQRATNARATRVSLWRHLLGDLVVSVPTQWLQAARRLPKHVAFTTSKTSGEPMDVLIQDLRFAVRALVKRPVINVVAIITLALGIGATTTIFSVVQAVLLRPLPWPAPERLVQVNGRQGASTQEQVSLPDVEDWRTQSRTIEEIGVIRMQSVNLTGVPVPDRLYGIFVSASTLRVFNLSAAIGRMFQDAETDVRTPERVAVLSNGTWQSRFGSDPEIVGKPITLNGTTFTIVGVLPASASFPAGVPDVFLPIPFYPNAGGLERGAHGFGAYARLRAGATIESAQRELDVIASRLAATYPATNTGIGASLFPLKDQLIGDSRTPLLIVLAAVGAVLLIACANVANLQLARATSRRRELSLRAAIGAGRSRLMRQLLTESLLLAALGGAAGLALARLLLPALAHIVESQMPLYHAVEIDLRVLLFAGAATMLSAVLFGAFPAWRASRVDLQSSLGARSDSSRGRARSGARNAIVVAQLALSIVLLVSAGLLARSVFALRSVATGFNPNHLLTMEFRLPPTKYDTEEKIIDMFSRTIAEVRSVPGVTSAALARAIPLSGNGEGFPYAAEGSATKDGERAPRAQVNTLSPGYFRTMELPLRAGRDFTDQDRAGTPPVVIVNEVLARVVWPNEPAVGKQLRLGDKSFTVIGVAANAKHYSLGESPLAQAYLAYRQRGMIFTSLVARTTGDPMLVARAVRDAIWRVDRDQPMWKIRPLQSVIDSTLGAPQLLGGLTMSFAALAMLLACVGIYGVMSYAVVQRTNEVGIRMALGAQRSQVLSMVVGQGMKSIGLAVALGLGGAAVAAQLLRSQLFGVSPLDPLTYALVPLVLGAVALLACYLPARRASRVDPLVALRAD